LQLVGADAVAELAEFVDEIAQLGDHGITSEPAMHFLRLGKGGETIADAAENAVGGLAK